MALKNYVFQSEFALRHRAEGRNEGRAEGRAEGRNEGRAEASAETLLKQLRLKFGPPDEATEQRVRAASEAEFDRWTERILTATSLADLFDDHV